METSPAEPPRATLGRRVMSGALAAGVLVLLVGVIKGFPLYVQIYRAAGALVVGALAGGLFATLLEPIFETGAEPAAEGATLAEESPEPEESEKGP